MRSKKIKIRKPSMMAFKSLGIVACLLAMLGGCQEKTLEAVKPTSISIGLQPNEGTADLETFKSELARLSGLSVNVVISGDYQDLVTKFKNAKVDFAFFSPVNFVTAEKEAGAKVLLKKVYGKSEFYFSAIIVKADSLLKKLSDLKSKKIGFVDPKSASGFLYPKSMLKEAGLGEDNYSQAFSGTHDIAVNDLNDGKFDAVAVWSDTPEAGGGAWSEFEKTHPGTKFRVLQYSDPIPNDAFAVRSDFYSEHPEIAFRIMEALITMSDTEVQALKKVFDTDKMTTATSRHYDSVRKMLEASQP